MLIVIIVIIVIITFFWRPCLAGYFLLSLPICFWMHLIFPLQNPCEVRSAKGDTAQRGICISYDDICYFIISYVC